MSGRYTGSNESLALTSKVLSLLREYFISSVIPLLMYKFTLYAACTAYIDLKPIVSLSKQKQKNTCTNEDESFRFEQTAGE